MKVRLRDGHGKPVPKRLVEPFLNRAALMKCVSRLQGVGVTLDRRADLPGGECLDMKEIRRHMHAIQYLVSNGVPYEICEQSVNRKCWMSMAEISGADMSILPAR